MSNSNDEYLEATKEARINQYSQGKASKGKQNIMIPLMLVSTVVVGYLGYSYMEKSESIDNELIVTVEPQKEDKPINREINKGEKVVEVSSQKEASTPKNYFVITVKKGDTLASFSKKYFGNEMFFNRILAFNEGLKEKSVLNIGQKIHIPR